MVAKGKGPTKKKKVLGMPHGNNCSFCGKDQKAVPLMVRSPVTNASICAFCAMNIVEQSMAHMVQVSSAFNQVVQSKPEWFDQDQNTGAVSFVDPEKAMDRLIVDANGN
jgi:ClpX C4-type zinc finger.